MQCIRCIMNIRINRLLLSEGIPVVEYIDTTEGRPYVFADDRYWWLMKRIKGTVFDPYVGDPKQNGFILGKAEKLHISEFAPAPQREGGRERDADYLSASRIASTSSRVKLEMSTTSSTDIPFFSAFLATVIMPLLSAVMIFDS